MSRPAKSAFYIPSLDGIRALAFSIVFLSHAGLGDLIPGGFGVTIFFFLSGYLITTLLRKEFGETGTISLVQFYARRTLRILPPFYITLALAVLATLAGLLPGRVEAWAVAAQSAFLTNYYAIFGPQPPGWPIGTDVLWSLAVEEHFYLLFPLAAIILLRRGDARSRATILGLACLGFLAWRCILVFGLGRGDLRTAVASDSRMDSILFGCILALWHNPAIDDEPGPRVRAEAALYAGSIGVLAACLLFRAPWFRETFRYSLQGAALFPLFYLAVARPDRPWFRWLNWPRVRFCGVLSYSLYLVHLSALGAANHLLPSLAAPLRAALALAFSLGYALTLYSAVERPLARLRKRLHADAPPAPDYGPGLVAEPAGAMVTAPPVALD